MKRLLCTLLSVCFLPLTLFGSPTPSPEEDWVTVAPCATPAPTAEPVAIPPDPNWVLAEAVEAITAAFAPAEPVLRHHKDPRTGDDELVGPGDPAFEEESEKARERREERREELLGIRLDDKKDKGEKGD